MMGLGRSGGGGRRVGNGYVATLLAAAVLFGVVVQCAAEVGTPSVIRGIAPKDRKRYKAAVEGKTFKCFDGVTVVKSSALNDDYCDCPDGSDEPGTSACPNARFHCQNKNYLPKFVPSMFVDDGVCDCCDGTDERSGNCKNTCAEDGKELRSELQSQIRAIEHGLREKGAMVGGNAVDEEDTARQVALVEKKINATSILVDKLEEKIKALNRAQLEEHEKKMREEMGGDDGPGEGEDYDEEEAGDVSDEEYEAAMEEGEGSGETDEDVGRKIASRWTRDPNAAQKDGEGGEAAPRGEGEGDDAGEPAKPEGWDEEEDGEWEPPAAGKSEEDDFDYDTFQRETETIEPAEAEPTKGSQDSFLSIFSRGINIVKKVFGKDEQQMVQAELTKQKNELKRMEDELKRLRDLTTLDFGENNQFLKFYGQCFKKVIEKYTYEICPYGQAKQDHTSLGNFHGLGDDRKTFLFTNGAKCWNGPNRSITVTLKCGSKNELGKVAEPSVCEYVADFTTPVACEESELEAKLAEYRALTGKGDAHDEL